MSLSSATVPRTVSIEPTESSKESIELLIPESAVVVLPSKVSRSPTLASRESIEFSTAVISASVAADAV